MEIVSSYFFKIVPYLLYTILVVISGVTTKWIIEKPVKEQFGNWRLKKVNTLKHNSKKVIFEHPVLKHVQLLIKATNTGKTEKEITAFLIVTTFLFGFVFLFSYFNFHDLFLSIGLSLLSAIVPYLVLQVKLRKMRMEINDEFLNLTRSLTQNYNSSQFDIYRALVQTSSEVNNKTLQAVMYKLVSDLQVSGKEEELRKSIDIFIHTVGSSWAKRLGNIILKSYIAQENVLATLMMLVKQIEETEKMLKEENAASTESVLDGWITLPLFIASLFLGKMVAGAQDWVSLQFKHDWNLLMFTLTVVGVVFSLLIAIVIKQPKNDL